MIAISLANEMDPWILATWNAAFLSLGNVETLVRSVGWEDPLEKGKATHSSVLAWRIQDYTVHGVTKSRTPLSNFHFHFFRHWSKCFTCIPFLHLPLSQTPLSFPFYR